MCDPKKPQHELEIQEATHFLLDVHIPKFASFLEKTLSKHNEHELIDLVHNAGINLRYSCFQFFIIFSIEFHKNFVFLFLSVSFAVDT
jgi:hypothetical protein